MRGQSKREKRGQRTGQVKTKEKHPVFKKITPMHSLSDMMPLPLYNSSYPLAVQLEKVAKWRSVLRQTAEIKTKFGRYFGKLGY